MFGLGPMEGMIAFGIFALQLVVPIGFLLIIMMLYREMRRIRESIEERQ